MMYNKFIIGLCVILKLDVEELLNLHLVFGSSNKNIYFNAILNTFIINNRRIKLNIYDDIDIIEFLNILILYCQYNDIDNCKLKDVIKSMNDI